MQFLRFFSCNRKEVLALFFMQPQRSSCAFSCNRKEVLAVSRTQAQATRNQPQEELLLADAKRSSCLCIIFELYCKYSKQISMNSFGKPFGKFHKPFERFGNPFEKFHEPFERFGEPFKKFRKPFEPVRLPVRNTKQTV